jgi:hypothetical protein
VEADAMNCDDLLLWMSANGDGSWASYKTAVDELVLADDTDEDDADYAGDDGQDHHGISIHHRLRLNLERLGHAEFFGTTFENGWRVVPPCLVIASGTELPTAFLCGARTKQLLGTVESLSGTSIVRYGDLPECPDRILVKAETEAELQFLADSAGLRFQPHATRMLLGVAPAVDQPVFWGHAEMPFGGDWRVGCFITETLRWKQTTPDEARASDFGLFKFNFGYEQRYFLRLRTVTFRVPVQVGKYVVLNRSRRRVIAYDSSTHVLSVPVSCRPPLLIDRALTLCSGSLPGISFGRLEYTQVSKDVALATSILLRQ